MTYEIYKKWKLLPGQIATPYEWQVLRAIAKEARVNSPIVARQWTEPPNVGVFIPVMIAVGHLYRIGAIRRHKKQYWLIQPTEIGREMIDAYNATREFLRNEKWRSLRIENVS